ncbi:MAG: 3'(2'),5'-bisphosphate nucleotidase CysQ [Candidatus Thorarchaeota archaeon]
MSKFNKELRIAVKLARNATEITEWFRKRGFKSFLKGDHSPVTLADLASQIYIISQLKYHFSDDMMIAEEENIEFIDNKAESQIEQCYNELNLGDLTDIREKLGYRGEPSQRQWTIDPIDGTIGFQKGLYYAIGIGFMKNSIPKICTISVPNYKGNSLAIFSAVGGNGAQVSIDKGDFKSIAVSQQDDLESTRLCHSLHHDKPWVLELARKIGINKFLQIDSMAKFCMVADGSADLYIKPLDLNPTNSWDFLPGDLLVREAGGKVTDLNGIRLRFEKHKCLWTGPGIIASNGIVQQKILELIKRESI